MLTDIRMPGMDGIAATEAITAAAGSIRVVMLTTFDQDDTGRSRRTSAAC